MSAIARWTKIGGGIAAGLIGLASALAAVPTPAFPPLFNGKDLAGWKVPAGDNGHWSSPPALVQSPNIAYRELP